MKAKRILSVLLTAAIAVSSLVCGAVSASAASSKKKLITVPLSEISATGRLVGFGNGIYLVNDHDFIKIGEEEIAQWKKTGKLTPKKVKTDFVFPEYWEYSGKWSETSNSIEIVETDSSGKIKQETILVYDKEKNRLKKFKTFKDGEWKAFNAEGYIISSVKEDTKAKTMSVTVTKPDGKTFTNKFKTSELMYLEDKPLAYYYYVPNSGKGKFIYYMLTVSGSKFNPKYEGTGYIDYIHNVQIRGVDKNGKAALVAEYPASYFGMINADSGCMLYAGAVSPGGLVYYAYLPDSGKTVTISDYDSSKSAFDGQNKVNAVFNSITSFSKDGKAISYFAPETQAATDGAYGIYKLLDLNGKVSADIGKPYKAISTIDEKTYLVRSLKDKWGFMDSKGKELGWFDHAGEFCGSYAPVVKNGKVYLVDKKLKTVSKKLSADTVYTYKDGLYLALNGNNAFLFTYK